MEGDSGHSLGCVFARRRDLQITEMTTKGRWVGRHSVSPCIYFSTPRLITGKERSKCGFQVSAGIVPRNGNQEPTHRNIPCPGLGLESQHHQLTTAQTILPKHQVIRLHHPHPTSHPESPQRKVTGRFSGPHLWKLLRVY